VLPPRPRHLYLPSSFIMSMSNGSGRVAYASTIGKAATTMTHPASSGSVTVQPNRNLTQQHHQQRHHAPPNTIMRHFAYQRDTSNSATPRSAISSASLVSTSANGHSPSPSHASHSHHPLSAFSNLFNSSTSSRYAAADVAAYHAGYPGQSDDPNANLNLLFYSNRVESAPRPSGTIEEIHRMWRTDFDLLEQHHGYIQWLFPIREHGMNMSSQRLHLHELKAMRADPVIRRRLLRSYQMMLEFYGMRLVDARLGLLTRSDAYASRYKHLNRSHHNYLRITRILKCVGELGLEHLQLGFLLQVLKELQAGALSLSSVGRSARDYWLPVLRNEKERCMIQRLLKHVRMEERKGKDATITEAVIRQLLQEARKERERNHETERNAEDGDPNTGEANKIEEAKSDAETTTNGSSTDHGKRDAESDVQSSAASALHGPTMATSHDGVTVAASAAALPSRPSPSSLSPSSALSLRSAASSPTATLGKRKAHELDEAGNTVNGADESRNGRDGTEEQG